MKNLLKVSLAIFMLLDICNAARVLIFFPFPGKSHSILGEGLVRTLSQAGHEVTSVTPFPNPKQFPDVHFVDISAIMDTYFELIGNVINITSILEKDVDVSSMISMFNMLTSIGDLTFTNENLKKLLNDPTQKFDVIIIEWMFSDVLSGLQAIFECPYIWFSSIDPHSAVMKLIDEPLNPAYTADAFSVESPPFNFIARVKEMFRLVFMTALKIFYLSPADEKLYIEIFEPIVAKRGKTLPPFETVLYNASLMLGNSHVSLGAATRLPQSYIAIGGYHIDPNVKPLPQDLKKIMDNANNGVIYFSMGSNLKSKDLPDDMKRDLLKLFGELKQTVIWKFEETPSNLPKNVHILQWAPQPSILDHPNCKLFITHGGLLSTTEAMHFGVPIIGIPVFGDQFININRAVYKGFAQKVDLSYSLVKDLKAAIHEMLDVPKYAERMKELSTIYHDRPVSPGAELVHWVEHVVRTRGAPHLRSPALHVSLLQKLYLDLAALIIAAISIVVYMLQRLLRQCCSRKKNIENKKNSSKKSN